jgi:hypothetical protein
MNDVRFDPERVKGYFFIQMPENKMLRLYVKAFPEEHRFEFVSLKATGWSGKGEPFEDGDTNIEVFLHGSAMFDGVRHLYFGCEETDNYGYFYYQDLREIKWVVTQLEILEKTICSYPSHEYDRPS